MNASAPRYRVFLSYRHAEAIFSLTTSRISSAGATISVDNPWDSHGKHADRTAPVWKYWIRVETPAGVHGWIDPAIENSEDQPN